MSTVLLSGAAPAQNAAPTSVPGPVPVENNTPSSGATPNSAPRSYAERLEASLAGEQAGAPPVSPAPGAIPADPAAQGGSSPAVSGGGPAESGISAPAVSPTKRLALKLGLADLDNLTDDQIADRLDRVYEQSMTAAERAEAERQRLIEIAAKLPGAQPPAEPPQSQTPAAQAGWWNPPKVDERQVELYQEEAVDPATGRVTMKWRDDAPVALKQQVQAYQKYQQDFVRKFTSNPEEALAPMVEARAAQVVRQILAEERARTEAASVVETFGEQNKDWLFDRDPITNQPVVDGGRFKLSQEGQQFVGWMEEAAQEGVQSQAAQIRRAAEKRELHQLRQRVAGASPAAPPPSALPPAAPPAPVPTAEQIRAQKQQELLQRAVNPSSRATAVPAGGSVQNPNLPFAERLALNAARDGQL